MSYTGWALSTGFGSESASRCSGVCKTRLLNTCPLSANPSSAFLVAATCDQLTAVTWTSVVSDWLHTCTADVHMLTPDNAHQTGTHFPPTSDTIFSLSTFNRHTKTFIFLLAHAARLGILFYEKHAIHCYHFRCVPNRTQRD